MHRVWIHEPVCPSRNVTMTPRQRIALRREMSRQKADSAMLAQLQEEYQYDGIETCAGDGTCSIPRPIGINTGTLIKEFRARGAALPQSGWRCAPPQHWKAVEPLARVGLWGAHGLTEALAHKGGPVVVDVVVDPICPCDAVARTFSYHERLYAQRCETGAKRQNGQSHNNDRTKSKIALSRFRRKLLARYRAEHLLSADGVKRVRSGSCGMQNRRRR